MEIIRELGVFERAQLIAESQGPFHIVLVIQLEYGPDPKNLLQSFLNLKRIHPLLSVRVIEQGSKYYFSKMTEGKLPFITVTRRNETHWLEEAESELGIPLDSKNGDLIRAKYLYGNSSSSAEIIISISHVISDGISTGHLVNELLENAAEERSQNNAPSTDHAFSPAVETQFPTSFQGWRLKLRKFVYLVEQIMGEITYVVQSMGSSKPKVPVVTPKGKILYVEIDKQLLNRFSRRARKEGSTLSSSLNAALMLAVNRHLYNGKRLPMRSMTFVNLRNQVRPLLGEKQLGLYISPIRQKIILDGSADFWPLAHKMQEEISRSLRSGEKYLTVSMTEALLKMLSKSQAMRLCHSALNYSGVIPVKTEIGAIIVKGVHSFISPHKFGPQFSGEALIFREKLILDVVYMDHDMDGVQANLIIDETRNIIQAAAA